MLEHEGDLALGLGLDQRGHRHAGALVDDHAVGELAEVRLVDLEHVHHRLAGDADLLADDALALLQAAGDQVLLDGVGILDAQLRETLGQRGDRLGAAQGVEQFVAQRRV
ncbi:hypothetical protein D3C80_1557070 [compost metagenome]